jgi:hypothetical protein
MSIPFIIVALFFLFGGLFSSIMPKIPAIVVMTESRVQYVEHPGFFTSTFEVENLLVTLSNEGEEAADIGRISFGVLAEDYSITVNESLEGGKTRTYRIPIYENFGMALGGYVWVFDTEGNCLLETEVSFVFTY